MANLAFTMMHIRDRVKKCSRSGDGYSACCPVPEHDDRHQSFSFAEKGDRVVVHCFAGCSQEAIRRALNLEWQDLCSDEELLRRKAEWKFNVRPSRPTPPKPKPKDEEKPPPDFGPLLNAARALPEHRKNLLRLADELGATPESREAYADAADLIGATWVPRCKTMLPYLPYGGRGWVPCWVIPEKDVDGKVIGITRRYAGGEKKAWPGSKRGLTYAGFDWTEHGDREKPVLCPEGASDVIALLACGFLAVGRPSNVGGVEYLVESLSVVPAGHPVIVLGENDRKTNREGKQVWPGKEGMEKVAAVLAKSLPIARVFTSMPQAGRKDTRQALAGVAGAMSWDEFLLFFDEPKLCPYVQCAHNPTGTVAGVEDCAHTYPDLLAGLPTPPPTCACRRGGASHLIHTSDHTKQRATRHGCDGWGCPVCRRRLAHRWVTHLASCIDRDSQAGHKLVSGQVSRDRFDRSLSVALRRRGADWCALEICAGIYLVVAALPAGASCPDALTEHSLEAICQRLVAWATEVREGPEAFSSRNKKMRPVRTSKTWQLHRQEPPGEWKVVGKISTREIDPVLDVVRQEGAKVVCETAGPGEERQSGSSLAWLVEWRCEPEVAERIAKRLKDLKQTPADVKDADEGESYTPFDGSEYDLPGGTT